jgi:hypothetical protein
MRPRLLLGAGERTLDHYGVLIWPVPFTPSQVVTNPRKEAWVSFRTLVAS